MPGHEYFCFARYPGAASPGEGEPTRLEAHAQGHARDAGRVRPAESFHGPAAAARVVPAVHREILSVPAVPSLVGVVRGVVPYRAADEVGVERVVVGGKAGRLLRVVARAEGRAAVEVERKTELAHEGRDAAQVIRGGARDPPDLPAEGSAHTGPAEGRPHGQVIDAQPRGEALAEHREPVVPVPGVHRVRAVARRPPQPAAPRGVLDEQQRIGPHGVDLTTDAGQERP